MICRELEENDEDPEELMAGMGQGYQSDMMTSTTTTAGLSSSQKPMMMEQQTLCFFLKNFK